MRYLIIREDGIIAGYVEAQTFTGRWDETNLMGDAVPKRSYKDPMIAKAMDAFGKQAKLYVIEPGRPNRDSEGY